MNNFVFVILFLTFLSVFFSIVFSQDLSCDTGCPTSSSNCVLSCGQTITDQTTNTNDTFNYSLPSFYMNVTFNMNPSPLANYDLIYNLTTNQCPLSTCNKRPTGLREVCPLNLSLGTYIIGVNKSSGTGTYNFTMTCQDYCSQCPWPDMNCNMSFGQSVSDLNMSNGQFQYFFYTLNSPKRVNITMTQPNNFVNFDLYTNWTANQCPITRCNLAAAGQNETCSFDLPAGTYVAGVKRTNTATGTYSLSISSEDVTMISMISSPQNITYYSQPIDLITKCTGSYASYNINRSLDDGQNITFGVSIANDTFFPSTLPPLLDGGHKLYITCYNGSISNSSIIYFTSIIPRYNLEAWVSGPSLFTIGKTELVSIYVKNIGNLVDNYNISSRKYAQKATVDVSHLVNVYFPSDRIVSVEPGKVGNTFAEVTVLGSIDSGNIYFNVTSETNSPAFRESSIIINAGSPINLPEFRFFGLLQIFFFALIIFYTCLRFKH